MHQDAFAADYREDENRLIGIAISFARIDKPLQNQEASCRSPHFRRLRSIAEKRNNMELRYRTS
jgi:hypothetical protein